MMFRSLAVAVWMLSLGAATMAHAAVINFDFSTAAQYGDNFVESLVPSSLTHNGPNQNVVYTAQSDNGTGVFVYDTLPANGVRDNADFLTETISADVSFGSLSTGNRSAGIFARVQAGGSALNTGILALVNTLAGNGNSVHLRLFYGGNITTTSAGTAFYDATFNLVTGAISGTDAAGSIGSTNTFAAGAPLSLVLTQTDDADPVFSLTLSDADGLIAASGFRTLTSAMSDAYDGPGAIGMRFNAPTTSQTITVDNFAAIPEPGTLALALGGFAGLCFVRRRK